MSNRDAISLTLREDTPSDRVLIGGVWQPASKGETLALLNPSTGKFLANIARGTGDDIDLAVAAARGALEGSWGAMNAAERGRILMRMSRIVRERSEYLAGVESADVGKPYSQALADARALERYFEFYGGAADKLHGSTIPYTNDFTVLTLREPYGITGHIIPWNYPMQIIGRSVGAALAMGNAVILKPAEEACLSALVIGDIAIKAGLPPGALNVVPGLGEEAGAALAAHQGVDHISFTGSGETGARVQAACGLNATPVTLELGGKSPQIVFADADMEAALPFLVNGGIQNAGQTCSASSRILVEEAVYDEVVARMAERYGALRVGPADTDAHVGPVISKAQRRRVIGYLEKAREDRLTIAAQAALPQDLPEGGYYIAPTLLKDVPRDHIVAQEEIFGPVQIVMPFVDEADASGLANNTGYGLVAAVWTRDGARQMRVARAVRAGQVFINNYGAGGGVELPFGGMKRSGHGREKGFEALYGFSTTKTIAIKHER